MVDTQPGSAMPEGFKKYWLSGPGRARIRWGEDGDYSRCITNIQEEVVKHHGKPLSDGMIHGLCSSLHHEATGAWPGHAPGESKPGSKH